MRILIHLQSFIEHGIREEERGHYARLSEHLYHTSYRQDRMSITDSDHENIEHDLFEAERDRMQYLRVYLA